MSRPSARRQGVTLVEMVLVVAVLAIAATIVLPKADVVSPAATDAAAGQVADAMRFARREAMRTGVYHVVMFDTTAQTVRVYRLTTSGTVAEDTSKPVFNPLDLRAYSISFASASAPNPTLVAANFKYGTTNATYASFGPDGNPADIRGWTAKDIYPLQQDGTVTVGHGAIQRTVTVAAATGRVTS